MLPDFIMEWAKTHPYLATGIAIFLAWFGQSRGWWQSLLQKLQGGKANPPSPPPLIPADPLNVQAAAPDGTVLLHQLIDLAKKNPQQFQALAPKVGALVDELKK